MIMNLNAYPTETTFPFTEAQFVTLTNNGSVPITYNFDASVTSTGNVTLQPGQSSTDFRTCTVLHVQSSNGIQPIQLELEREISDQFGSLSGSVSTNTTNISNNSKRILDYAIFVTDPKYGAKGDGVDDTTAILAAYADVPVGGTLFFPHPSNSYVMKQSFAINKSITIRGAGSGQYTDQLIFVGCSGLVIGAINNVQVLNIEIALATRYTTTVNSFAGIQVNGTSGAYASNHVYRDVYVDGFKIAFQASYIWSSTFDNFRCGYCHIGKQISGLSVNNWISDPIIGVDGSVGSKGIYFTGDVANEGWTIIGGLINGAEIGIHGIAMAHVRVKGVIIDHCLVNGILIADNGTNFGGNWDIEGNYIAISGTGGDAAIKSTNSMADSQNRGNKIRGNDLLIYSGAACNYGIWMQGAEARKNQITAGNSMKGFSINDIRCATNDNVITDNQCESAITTNIQGGGLISNNAGTVYYQRSTDYSTIGMMKVSYDQAVPTTGSMNRGDITFNITPAVGGFAGWSRLTTGSGNVLGTDWGTFGGIPLSVSDYLLPNINANNVAALQPSVQGNFTVWVYYRVVTAATNLTLTLTYNDGTGVQTVNIITSGSQAVGSYRVAPIFINATSAAYIVIQATAGTANQIYISTTIRPE